MRRPALVLLLLATLFCVALPARPPAAPADLGQTLWNLKQWSELGPQVQGSKLKKAAELLANLDRTWNDRNVQKERIVFGLLDFLGRCISVAQDPEGQISGPQTGSLTDFSEKMLRVEARRMLRQRRALLGQQLTMGVLMGRVEGKLHPPARRAAACEVLGDEFSDESTLALLASTRPQGTEREVPPLLMNAALAALSGRQGEGVHLRLLDLLRGSTGERHPIQYRAIEAHFGSIRIKAEQTRLIVAILHQAAGDLEDGRWRRASRGLSLVRALPDDVAFPMLIGALETWVERRDGSVRPTARILGEITAQLSLRSGRHLGAHPTRWRTFWEAYLRGQPEAKGTASAPRTRTQGSFFGLRPATDRIVFVLDRSGSMQAPFGETPGQTRLGEAVVQMGHLLQQLGPKTRFGVVIFNGETKTWQEELKTANLEQIKAASAWILDAGASGGTELWGGVRQAMEVDGAGHVQLEKLEADTIIVLCDGETQEGPSWVEPFLKRENDGARVVFHAVQLGETGDGTLEALAGLSGGQFLRIKD